MSIKIDNIGTLVNCKRVDTRDLEYYDNRIRELQYEYNRLNKELQIIEFELEMLRTNRYIKSLLSDFTTLKENGLDLNEYLEFHPFSQDDNDMSHERFKTLFQKEFNEKIIDNKKL